MSNRIGVVVIVVLAVAAACSEPDGQSTTTTVDAAGSEAALVTIPPPVSEPTTASTGTTTPSTARAPIEIRTFPDPDWPAVAIPTAPAVEPVALTQIVGGSPGARYDISPDGSRLVSIDTNALCVMSLSDPSARVCVDGIDPTQAAWSPDSGRVVFLRSSITRSQSAPLALLATDGELVTLLETDDPASPFGGATAAGFVDDDTVVYTRMLVAPAGALTYQVHTVDVDGSNDTVVGTLDIGGDVDVFFPASEVFDGTTVYFQPNGPSMRPGTWRFEPETGAFGLVEVADDGTPFSARPHMVRGGLLITVDGERLASSTTHRDDARFFTISSIDRSASAVIEDVDDEYMILSAALSPDGAHVAVFELYRGDERQVADSEASGRVSITSTASLFRDDAEWSTITDVGPGTPSLDLDREFSTITWPTPDRIHVELTERAFAVDVAPAA